jgi:hypothetical protein
MAVVMWAGFLFAHVFMQIVFIFFSAAGLQMMMVCNLSTKHVTIFVFRLGLVMEVHQMMLLHA